MGGRGSEPEPEGADREMPGWGVVQVGRNWKTLGVEVLGSAAVVQVVAGMFAVGVMDCMAVRAVRSWLGQVRLGKELLREIAVVVPLGMVGAGMWWVGRCQGHSWDGNQTPAGLLQFVEPRGLGLSCQRHEEGAALVSANPPELFPALPLLLCLWSSILECTLVSGAVCVRLATVVLVRNCGPDCSGLPEQLHTTVVDS